MQRQEVEGMATYAPHLEVGKKRLWRNAGVEHIRVLELSRPRILDDGEDELRSLLLHRPVNALVGSLGLVSRFRAQADDGRGIVIDHRVVGANICWFGELRAIVCCVCCHRPNEDDDVVYVTCFVVWYLEEELRQYLPDSREVNV